MGREVFESFRPRHERLVCIDSDGCAFDTMEIKHKECFCPAMIKHWGLQPISKYARMAWEFENLYSKDRGLSRFITLYRSIELLKDWDEVREYDFVFPDTEALGRWLREAPAANNAALAGSDDPVLKRTLDWSLESNERISDMVYGIPPFPHVRESIVRLSQDADIIVVSATAREAPISRKVSTALKAQMESGEFKKRNLPYGYRWDEEHSNMVFDEETAPIVRKIFQWKIEGLSLPAIADRLDAMNAPNPEFQKYQVGVLSLIHIYSCSQKVCDIKLRKSIDKGT